jgi:adenine-specific DNA-methyltransferase
MAQLQFKGKAFVQNYHLAVKYHELVPVKSKSLTDKVSLRDNLIIHGDNLKALKALLPLYAAKIKCIYIDPPYNTGNENWVYNDNVNSPMMQDWLGKVVDREDLTRHDKWLCMMMPRLNLLRDLLSDDGVIFVSIDDIEAARLHLLMDEIFGEERFLAQLCWKSRQNKDNRNITGISVDHEYVLCYGQRLRGAERRKEQFSNPDDDPRGPWVSGNMVGLATQEARPNLHYDLLNPETGTVYKKPTLGWRFDRTRMKQLIDEKRILWPNTVDGRPRLKVFLSEMSEEFTGYSSMIGSSIFTRTGTAEIEEIFGKRVFEFPKPSALIRDFLRQATDSDSIVLDSFAGTAPLAHAVLHLNQEDGGSRRFILIECEKHADTITAERVRRVIRGVPGAKDESLKKGLGGTFSYFELGKAIELQSILDGSALPTYMELGRYVFYTATGEEFDEKVVDPTKHFIGESRNYDVYLIYEPNVEKLKNLALTLDMAKAMPPARKDKRRLVFAPTKYLDQDHLDQYRIDFAQLPFEIYDMAR